MVFTKEDYLKILLYLLENSKKDTDFPLISAEDVQLLLDTISLIHNNENRNISIEDLLSLYSNITSIKEELDLLLELKEHLSQDIEDLKVAKIGIEDSFGNSSTLAASQKTVTQTFDDVWKVLEDITGNDYTGYSIDISPLKYFGNTGTTITCTVKHSQYPLKLDYVRIFKDGEQVEEALDVESNTTTYSVDINGDSTIKVEISMAGIPYYLQENIKHYTGFWIGSGDIYSNVMHDNCLKDVENGLKGSYNVTIEDNRYLILLMHESLEPQFTRADLNGIEIAFERTVRRGINGQNYIEFKSKKPLLGGTYNIDINS